MSPKGRPEGESDPERDSAKGSPVSAAGRVSPTPGPIFVGEPFGPVIPIMPPMACATTSYAGQST